jgi:aminopeptidase N
MGLDPGARIRNAGADVINSLRFYEYLFDDKLDNPQIYVTAIAAGHGQAFDGFLHLSEFTYVEHPGATELFRAHEVAHEWFGHKIGWKTYRDQWLSESFAEYASMMFVQATVKGGDKYYDEIINAYEGIVQGTLAGGFSKFNRPWLIEFNASARARLGPIGVGYRAGTSDMPNGYQIQAYHKGPLVLHMMRTMLRYKTHSDDTFIKILRDFVKEYSGKEASTADFQRVVEKNAPGDWSYFFDAWVYDSAIPTLRWNYKIDPTSTGGAKLTVNVKRSGVRDDFMIVAPVLIEFDGGRSGTFFMAIRKNEETASQDLPSVPRKVVFAPAHSVLATIKRE